MQYIFTYPIAYGLRIQGSTKHYGGRRVGCSASISDSLMIYNFIASVKRLEIGANGICSYISSDKYLYLAQNGNDDTFMEVKGKTDMPGVLCAGRVRSGGNIDNQWGCKTCGGSRYNGQVGQYKMTHNIGHLDYYVTATPIHTTWAGQCMIKEKTETYVVINLSDVQSNWRDGDFEFMICGKN